MRVLTHSSGFQVANNHFAHFFAPQNLTNLNKNLVFVIDISTSMEGQKVKQVNCALKQFTQRKPLRPHARPTLVLLPGAETPCTCLSLFTLGPVGHSSPGTPWPSPPACPPCTSALWISEMGIWS